jgi:pentose-5-phosphate-3-epimerase
MLVDLAKMFEIMFGVVLLADLAMYFEHYFDVHLMIEFGGSKFQSCRIKKGLHQVGNLFQFHHLVE